MRAANSYIRLRMPFYFESHICECKFSISVALTVVMRLPARFISKTILTSLALNAKAGAGAKPMQSTVVFEDYSYEVGSLLLSAHDHDCLALFSKYFRGLSCSKNGGAQCRMRMDGTLRCVYLVMFVLAPKHLLRKKQPPRSETVRRRFRLSELWTQITTLIN
jgi:hypothetical protein